MAEYTRVTEAEAISLETVIPRWKPFLNGWDIGYVEVDKMRSKGVDVWAKVKKCSPLEKHLTDHDLLLITNGEVWPRLNRAQKIALLHHEFCHVEEIKDKDGERQLSMLPHDLEAFAEEVRVHGLWRPAIENFASQLELNLNEGVTKPKPSLDPHAAGTAFAETMDAREDVAAPNGGVTSVTFKTKDREVILKGAAALQEADEAIDEALEAAEVEGAAAELTVV